MTLTSAPTYHVYVSFSGATETDIVSDVIRCSITRGRSRERESMSPGRADLELWNYAGNYDPDNTSGAYYPNVRPNKPIRIVASLDSGTSPFTIGSSAMGGGSALGGGTVDVALFTGRLEGGPMTFAVGGLQPTVTWKAIDGSKRLNRDRSTTGFGSGDQLTGARVSDVLDGGSPPWPDLERDIDPGVRTVQASTGDAGRYDYLQTVAESEGGAFFIGGDGHAVFRDSDWEPSADATVLGSSSGEYDYSSIEITDDEQEIFNEVSVTANALTTQTAADVGSQAEFGRADLSLSTILSNTAEMDDLANARLLAYSQPRRRISQLRVDRIAEDWYWFLSKELQDRVTVRHRPVYGGTLEQESVIQGINLTVVGSQDWELIWNLSPPVLGTANLLSDNQASIETDASGWVAEANCSISRTTDQHMTGEASLAVDVTAIPASLKTTPVGAVPVTVGTSYTAEVHLATNFAGAQANVEISWCDGGGAELSVSTGTSDYVHQWYPWLGVDEGWTVTGTAPVSAVNAVLRVEFTYFGGPDRFYLDAAILRENI